MPEPFPGDTSDPQSSTPPGTTAAPKEQTAAAGLDVLPPPPPEPLRHWRRGSPAAEGETGPLTAGPAALPPVPGYELLEELGRGGMGVVYQARHLSLGRLVALKMILTGGHASTEQVARFRREAEDVARLQHPHIVQIHEIGEYNGLPYFSLEYCDGGNLQAKVNGTPLPARQAVQLVESLARAVQAAHERGIIHRDLKPANVLLTADGVAKITDFGLAKRLNVEPEVLAAGPATQSGAIIGTPSYMAPEQASGQGQPVGPAADIYALGALLYELLTGRPPFKAETLLDTVLQVLHEEPVAPSWLNPKVPRDLETICQKCLQKEPGKRYASARALAEDLRRFQAGEPIVARPGGRLERTVKWAQRNKALAGFLATLAVGVISLGSLTVVVGMQNSELAEANQREHAAAELAQRTNAELRLANQRERAAAQLAQQTIQDMTSPKALAFLEKQPELQPEQRAFLQQAVAYYRKAVSMQAQGEEAQVQQAQAFCSMGYLQLRLGLHLEALATYRAALQACERLAADHPLVAQYRRALASSHNNLGVLLADLGKWKEAEAAYRAAVKEHARLVADHPRAPKYRQELARSHNSLGSLLKTRGKRSQAEAAYRAALKELVRLVLEDPLVPEYREELASTHNNLGVLLTALGKWKEAEAAHRAAFKEQARLAAEHPQVPGYRQELARSHNGLGILLKTLGKWKQAEAACRAAHKELARLAAEHPLVPEYRHQLATSHNNLGALLAALGNRKEAEEQFRAALKQRERLATEHPQVAEYRQELATSHDSLGILLKTLGQLTQAEAACRAALKERARLAAEHALVPEYRHQLGRSYNNLGTLLSVLGKWQEAEAEYRTALKEQARLADEHPHVREYRQVLARSHYNLGFQLARRGKRAEAEAQYRAALNQRALLAAEHPQVAEYRQELAASHNNLGILLFDLGKQQEAEAEYRAALKEQARLAAEHPEVAQYVVDLGGSYCNLGILSSAGAKPGQALAWYAKAIATLQGASRTPGGELTPRLNLRNSHAGRAEVLGRLGQHTEAAKDWEQSLAVADGRTQPFFRLKLADSLARAGEHGRATATAEELIKAGSTDPNQLYDTACVFALAAAQAKEKALADRYATRSVALLRQAIDRGFKDLEHMQKDPDLETLRGRADFQKLLAALGNPE
jgi:serine/threonine-protein kinase